MDRPAHPAYECYATPKRIRVLLGRTVFADSRRTILLRADHLPPEYYFPWEDVREGALQENGRSERLNGIGEISLLNIQVNGTEYHDAAWRLDRPEPVTAPVAGRVGFVWGKMEGWFEEDIEVFVHPRDPRTRVDIAPSSSHVEVVMDGTTVAVSDRPLFLFETGLPVRYYLPKLDVRLDLLERSDSITYCPYKGEARYYSLRVGDHLESDMCWYYRYPTLEASAIATQIAFYQERVAIYVDGDRV